MWVVFYPGTARPVTPVDLSDRGSRSSSFGLESIRLAQKIQHLFSLLLRAETAVYSSQVAVGFRDAQTG